LGLKLEVVRKEVLSILGMNTEVREGGSQRAEVRPEDLNVAFKYVQDELFQALRQICTRIEKLVQGKEEAVAAQDFEKAVSLRDQEIKLKQHLVDVFKKLQALLRETEDESR